MFIIICHSFQLFFQDFVIGLSVLARGSIQDKLRWTFSLYDINGDGIITKDELSRIIGSIYDLMGFINGNSILFDIIRWVTNCFCTFMSFVNDICDVI